MSYLEYNLSQSAWSIAKEALRDFATGPNFWAHLETAFGSGLDFQKAEALAADWGAGDFSGLPEIEVRPGVEINGAMGAFSGETNTIYFSQEYLSANAGNSGAVAGVWLEEVGHFVDSVVNSSDAVGDEGDIFSRLVRGEVLDGLELELLRGEDDRATVVLDGVEVAIEMNTRFSGDGSSVKGAIDFPGEEDSFTFTGKEGDNVAIGLINEDEVSLSLSLYDSKNNFVTWASARDENREISAVLPKNDTYTIIVDGGDVATGSYTLSLSNMGEDKIDSIAGDGATASGSLDFAFDRDALTFEGKEGDNVAIGLINEDEVPLSLSLYDSKNNFVTWASARDENREISAVLPKNDTYTIIVDGGDVATGSYTLGLSNMGEDKPTAIPGNGVRVNGSINFAFDRDAFTFTGKEGNNINLLAINKDEVSLSLSLYDSKNNFVTWASARDENREISAVLPKDDTYTVVVDGGDTVTGSYSLIASGLPKQKPTDNNNEDNRTGTSGNDKISGTPGNDKINGGGGNDRLNGGKGNDNLNGGTGKDRLNGGSGKDRLDGGKGADILNGGGGNDTYIIDNPKDKIQEKRGGGTDTVQTSINININKNTFGNVENIIIRGGKSPINGIGNAGKNRIEGNGGNNRIDGGGGNDNLLAGGGNDTINGGSGNDNIIAGSGNDKIDGGKGLDNIIAGGGNDTLIGGSGIDNLNGGSGNDRLTGGPGKDNLIGGSGSDRFIYESNRRFRQSDFGKDKIADFVIGQDDIVLDRTTFKSLESKAGNSLLKNDFAVIKGNASAATSSAEIVYNSSTGELFYNANGSAAGFGGGGKFATLTNEPALSRSDFIVQN